MTVDVINIGQIYLETLPTEIVNLLKLVEPEFIDGKDLNNEIYLGDVFRTLVEDYLGELDSETIYNLNELNSKVSECSYVHIIYTH